jgi:hypothetical protein
MLIDSEMRGFGIIYLKFSDSELEELNLSSKYISHKWFAYY